MNKKVTIPDSYVDTNFQASNSVIYLLNKVNYSFLNNLVQKSK